MVEVADSDLTFHSSAGAEAFILRHPSLRKYSLFSWWTGVGNVWRLARANRDGSFTLVSRKGGKFVAGDEVLGDA